MTQQQLADLIGVARGTVAMWECGGVWPSARLLPLIAGALVCSIDELFAAGEDPPAAGTSSAPSGGTFPVRGEGMRAPRSPWPGPYGGETGEGCP